MLAAVDVQYRDPVAVAACVTFHDWGDAVPRNEQAVHVDRVQEYVPGEFWRRELPCILRVLEAVGELPAVLLVDGHVWLDADGRKGLGAHLYDALDGAVGVIGVAKSRFHGMSSRCEVRRGESAHPLFVTSVGFDGDAPQVVRDMHGPYRIPTLLKRVDQLCRVQLAEWQGAG